MTATHKYKGYACKASMKHLSTQPRPRYFEDELVQLVVIKGFDVIFLDEADFIWITDADAWERKSQPLDKPPSSNG